MRAKMSDGGRPANQPARLRFWRRACAERSVDLTLHDGDGTGKPFFYFHGDYLAGGTYMARFAAEFGQRLASVSPHGLRDGAIPASVEAMAAERLPLVLATSPTGPFRLGGYCNGAMVAYEVACQLAAAGHEVERVVLVEPLSLSTHPFHRWVHIIAARTLSLGGVDRSQRVSRLMLTLGLANRLFHSNPRQAWHLVRILGGRIVARRRRQASTDVEPVGPDLGRAYLRILPAYIPGRSDFPVTVLSSGRDAAGRYCALYDGTGWRRLCARFEHVGLPGHHHSCLVETMGNLVGHIRDILDEALDAPPDVKGSPNSAIVGRPTGETARSFPSPAYASWPGPAPWHG